MSKITPCLWFDGNAQEAVDFYLSVFPNSKVGRTSHYPEGQAMAGQVLTIEFELDGRAFTALNAGPEFKFNEAVSFQIDCKDQAEVDRYWDALQAGGGEPGPCGWVKDRFGLSWQTVPARMIELITSADKQKAKRAMDAMMKMGHLDIAEIERAAAGQPEAVG